MIFVVRRTLVLRSAESLASRPDDPLTLSHWKTGYLATYGLCEALALSGIVLRFLGFNFQQSVPVLYKRFHPAVVLSTATTSQRLIFLV
jgi:hypothetical protein